MSLTSLTPAAAGIPGTYVGAALSRANNQGVINVASMGNDNRLFRAGARLPWVTYPIPAVWNNVISVGAINRDRSRSSYSNYGTATDIWAPGGGDARFFAPEDFVLVPGVRESCYNSSANFQCAFTDRTSTFNGTSAAAPIIAGTIALMKQVNPALRHNDVDSILKSTARTDTGDSKVGKILDAGAAVRAVGARR